MPFVEVGANYRGVGGIVESSEMGGKMKGERRVGFRTAMLGNVFSERSRHFVLQGFNLTTIRYKARGS